jgi:thioredoxin-related protein
MKAYIALAVMVLLCAFTGDWETDFAQAKSKAQQEHKYILLNFSGSDWCGPCIRMKKELFETTAFKTFADANLVLVNADFPRQKKNRLPKALQQQNDQLADTYNTAGSFPYTVLLNANGRVLKAWDGFPKENAAAFVNSIKQVIDEQR